VTRCEKFFVALSRQPITDQRVRIDKWLWAARFFKSRALAQAAAGGGKVKVHRERVKPAKEVRVGDEIEIRIGEYEWRVTVRGLSDRRGSAEIARKLYSESEESCARRIAQIADRRAHARGRGERKGRPTKRERRQLLRWRGEE
jgi:ribosome-associated heat shock protein Hsp15